MKYHIFALALALSTVFGSPTPTQDDEVACKTNAECLQRGMPILPRAEPKRRQGAGPSPLPVGIIQGIIRIEERRTRAPFGWIGRNSNPFNDFITSVPTEPEALYFSIDIGPGTANRNIRLLTPSDHPFLCGFPYSDDPDLRDLNAGSANSVGIGECGGPATLPNSPAILGPIKSRANGKLETAIFTFNLLTNEITIHWTNSNGRQPIRTIPVTANGAQGGFSLTGDFQAYKDSEDAPDPRPFRLFFETKALPSPDRRSE